MPRLQDRLADLAEEAPRAAPDPGLVVRARRYHRHRRAGTVVTASCVVVALALLAGLSWWRAAPPLRPAGSSSGAALPQRIEDPSPWLDGTGRAGPLGVLAAVVPADRGGWLGSSPGLVGVSATTGEYRYLDLPDYAENQGSDGPALAPDGRHVVYWTDGEPSGSTSPLAVGDPVAGVAVYDSVTGSVRRHPVPTEHGLEPEVLAWADGDTVVLAWGQHLGGPEDSDLRQGMTSRSPLRRWGLAEPAPRLLGREDGTAVVFVGGGSVLLDPSVGGRRTRLLQVDGAAPVRTVRLAYPVSGLGSYGDTVVVDEASQRVAGVLPDRSPYRFWAGDLLPGDGEAAGARSRLVVPGSRGTWGLLAWTDRDHVAALRARTPATDEDEHAVDVVDVATGEARRLLTAPRVPTVATDLLATESVARAAPPRPLDPRITAGTTVLVLLAGAWSLSRWRRRVRP